MKKSINAKILEYFLAVVVLVLAIMWVGINFYIKSYYYGQKIEMMQETVHDVAQSLAAGDQLEVLDALEYIGYKFGGKISIYDDNSLITIQNNQVGYQKGNIIQKIKHNGVTAYIYTSDFPVKGTKWLMYMEEMADGKMAMLEIPIESIDNTLEIVKQFFTYLVAISIIIAAVFSVVLSRSISKPVTKLNQIAKEMGKLNFQLKYTGKSQDEIGQLGQTLNELTQRLEETINQLKRELDKEKQLDVLRKSFVAQVSHELQTPLSVINGYIEALMDGLVETDDECQYYYEIIEDETAKMSKMVRALLDLSQLETGTFRMEMEKTDLTALIDTIATKYEKMANQREIDWSYSGFGDEVWITADPVKLEQGITNIINNAFKHTAKGDSIYIITEKSDNRLKLTVENDGQQISEEELGYIWESFYKGRTGEDKQGTGLGLAIAANIFKYHHIDYRAYNTQKGVAFELIFETN